MKDEKEERRRLHLASRIFKAWTSTERGLRFLRSDDKSRVVNVNTTTGRVTIRKRKDTHAAAS